jgi:hypothetical protein
MRLFTSNSKAPKAHIVLLLVLCAAFGWSVEAVTVFFFGRVSHVEKRRESEYRAALSMHSAKLHGKLSVLVAGNSLLLNGVNFPSLQQELGSDMELQRTVFENTYYFDWYYGLRHIFRAGAHPDVVVLVLNPLQLTSDGSEGDYIAHMLVDHHDVLRFANDLGADRNKTSVLALDNLSFFFGARAEIRTWILGKLLPDLPTLTRYFHQNSTLDLPSSRTISDRATERLRQLQDLCSRYGAEFVLVIPPARVDYAAGAVAVAGANQGISVLIPLPVDSLPPSDYSDAFHLNPDGAMKFTPALASSLKRAMPRAPALQTATMSPPLGQRDGQRR